MDHFAHFNRNLRQERRYTKAMDRIRKQAAYDSFREKYNSLLNQYAVEMNTSLSDLAPLRYPNLFRAYRNLFLRYLTASDKPAVQILTAENTEQVFLRLNLPYHHEKTPALLDELGALLSRQRLPAWRTMFDAASIKDQGLHQRVLDAAASLDVFNGHLVCCYQTDAQHLSFRPVTERKYPPLFSAEDPSTAAQYRRFFQTITPVLITRDRDARFFLKTTNLPLVLKPMKPGQLLYTDGYHLYLVHYDRTSKKLGALTAAFTGYPHSQKLLATGTKTSLRDQPAGFLRTLLLLTGGSPGVLDELSAFLSRLAAPVPHGKQLSVLLTGKNRSVWKRLLNALFDGRVFPRPGSPEYSMSDLLTERCKVIQAEEKGGTSVVPFRKLLLEEHVQGTFLLLPSGGLPTSKQSSLFLDLIHGQPIPVPDKIAPDQSFRNQMHVIYITQKPELAEELVSKYDARCLDLRPFEQVCPEGSSFQLEEILWLRQYFLPWGLIQQHRKRRKLAPVAPEPDLTRFLKEQCRVSSKLRCSREEVCRAYRTYYQTMYGAASEEGDVRFIKRFRKILPEKVEYKQPGRFGPEKKLTSGFLGLGVLPECQAVPAPQEPSEEARAAFLAYLQTVEAKADILPLEPPKPLVLPKSRLRKDIPRN